MLLWFAGVSFAAVWLVFRSPALDYRLVMLGAVLPLGDIVFGGPRLLHTLLGGAALLTFVVLATRGRRLLRRRLIGLPIGVLMHLVLDGVWARTDVFWWPFFGADFGPGGLPELDHGVTVALIFELVGAVALVWCWREFDFADPENRRLFLHTGRLNRAVVNG
jgi:hypothetical protein